MSTTGKGDLVYDAEAARLFRLAHQARVFPSMFEPGAADAYQAQLNARLAVAAADIAAGRTIAGLAQSQAAVVVASVASARDTVGRLSRRYATAWAVTGDGLPTRFAESKPGPGGWEE